MIIRSLKFWWWTEKACVNLWNLLNEQEWYDVSYFSFYKDKHTYRHTWTEFCLEKKSNSIFIKCIYCIIWAIKVLKICKNNNINIIISYMGSGILTAILSKIYGNKPKNYIYLHRCLNDFPKWISYLFAFFSKKYSNKIIVLTEYEKHNLIKNFHIDWNKIFIIPNFINIEDIHILQSEPLNNYENLFKNNKFTFITAGRLEKIKNQQLMVKTFRKLNNNYSNTQLLILWNWEEKWNLQKIANDNIIFLWNQENVFKFLNKSDCFILTSKSESFSIAILDAMVCKLPIISTETQWPKEILQDWKYWIIVDHNEKELYNTMEKILTDEDLRNFYKKQSETRIKDYQKNEIIKLRKNILNK